MNLEIAQRLQQLRKEKGYSQESLADELGISRQAVSKWERAEASPDTDNLILLARLYGMSLDELLYTTDSNEEIKDAEASKKEGMYLTDDEGQTLAITNEGIKCYDKDGNEVHRNQKSNLIKIIDTVYACIVVILYLVLSFVFKIFHPLWIIFLTIPVETSITSAINKKRVSSFLYPVFVTIIYLTIGFVKGGWHPHWWLFITIPVFYAIAGLIDKATGHDKDEEDED